MSASSLEGSEMSGDESGDARVWPPGVPYGDVVPLPPGAAICARSEDKLAAGLAELQAAGAGEAHRLDVTDGDAFTALRRFESEGRRFDTVVVDPPALAKRRGQAQAGPRHAMDRIYEELTMRALRITRAGGLVVTCSCLHINIVAFFHVMAEWWRFKWQ